MKTKKPVELHPKKIIDIWTVHALLARVSEHNYALMMNKVDRLIKETERRIKSGQLKNEPLPILDLADEDLLNTYL